MDPVRLQRASLDRLPAHVVRPAYDPAAVRTGIVHLGLGNFHRAHMARYTHDLAGPQPDALDWGIAGAGLLAADAGMHDDLSRQDRLYTLVERDAGQERVGVIGILSELILAAGEPSGLLEAMARGATRIVSLTVTENGYGLDRATKRLDPGNAVIAADLREPERPHSAVGVIVEACRRRMSSGRPPFTVLTCDNIQHNGDVVRRAVLDYAELRDPRLARWIEAGVCFPNTMVDRITPVTQAADVQDLAQRHGVRDTRPVFSETFSQWVIEDRFSLGRPAWEAVGAMFVDDVAPFEFMKLRLLNTTHLAVAALGRLIGHGFIDEAMGDRRLAAYVRALMDRETGPTLTPVPGVDIEAYKDTLVRRFANPRIKDTVERVNTDAPLNVLLDPIRDRLAADAGIDLLGLALAAWIRRVRGVDEAGAPIEVRHPLAALLRERADHGGADPRPVLAIAPLFGELGRDERLRSTVGGWLARLYADGAGATLDDAALTLEF